MTAFALLSTGCVRTRTVEVKVPVPVPVEDDTCPVIAEPLPPIPKDDPESCAKAYGDRGRDASCFSPAEAHRLAALLQTLFDTYEAAAACLPTAPKESP